MQKAKHHYIKYSRNELEGYTKDEGSCVKRVKTIEPIRFSPTILSDFKSSINQILSKKIGKYDYKLDGVVLDFRNTKVLNSMSAIRSDSPFTAINVETNFYVFAPRKGATVTGIVKYINRMSMETIISVVIYRVFNVKITVKGIVKQEFVKNQEIELRVKDFHFENVIPFIEGEVLDKKLFIKAGSSKKLFDDTTLDSGISESSLTSVAQKEKIVPSSSLKIKHERESSVESHVSTKPAKSKKRRLSDEPAVTPIVKKIKSEPQSPIRDDPGSTSQSTLKKKDKKRTLVQTPNQSFNTTLVGSTPKEPKQKKKKATRKLDDDFETSLQLLLNPKLIKSEL